MNPPPGPKKETAKTSETERRAKEERSTPKPGRRTQREPQNGRGRRRQEHSRPRHRARRLGPSRRRARRAPPRTPPTTTANRRNRQEPRAQLPEDANVARAAARRRDGQPRAPVRAATQGEALLRASVNRSWSSGRSALPAVAAPAFPDQPPDDDDHVRERYPKVDHPCAPLGTPHQLLVGVVPRVRALHHPPLSGLQRSRLALLGDLADQATGRKLAASGLRVVGAVQMHARSIR